MDFILEDLVIIMKVNYSWLEQLRHLKTQYDHYFQQDWRSIAVEKSQEAIWLNYVLKRAPKR